jgi:hypothetical protein
LLDPVNHGAKLSAEDAQKQYGVGNLKFDEPVSEARAKEMYDLKLAEMRRNVVLGAGPDGVGATIAKFGASVLASAADPLNIASAFLPTAAIRGAASATGRTVPSFITNRGGTVGSRFAGGASEGALGAAIIEPLPYLAAQRDQLDYTLNDSLLNIAIGGVLGGGLHAVGKYIGDRKASSVTRSVDKMSGQEKHDLIRAAVADAVDDKVSKNHGKAIRQEILKDIPLHMGEFYAGKVLADAPNAPKFDLGYQDKSLYRDYSAISEQDMRWIDGVVAQVNESNRGGLSFIERDGQGGTADVVGTPSTSPKWFKDYNKREKSKLTKEKVNRTIEKLKARKPLAAEEARIAETLFAEGRALREENARQVIDFRDHRAAKNRELFEQELNDFYARESEDIGNPDFSESSSEDIFNDMFDVETVNAFKLQKGDTVAKLQNETNMILEDINNAIKATGDKSDYLDLIDFADLEVKQAEGQADGWRALGACMIRKG